MLTVAPAGVHAVTGKKKRRSARVASYEGNSGKLTQQRPEVTRIGYLPLLQYEENSQLPATTHIQFFVKFPPETSGLTEYAIAKDSFEATFCPGGGPEASQEEVSTCACSGSCGCLRHRSVMLGESAKGNTAQAQALMHLMPHESMIYRENPRNI